MKVLIEYKDSVKVREIDSENEIHNIVELTFQLKEGEYCLKIYDDDFQEYIDLETMESIKNKSKIKVISYRESLSESVKKIVPDSSQGSFINSEISEMDVDIVLDLKLSHWPDQIIIPVEDFSRKLIDALNKENDLSWILTSELVSHLANYAYKFKKYPNKYERLQICHALIDKFPYLKNEVGNGTGGWELRLMNKLKKIRQCDTSLEITLNRQKRKSEGSQMPKYIKLNPEKGELNWSPDHFPGESEDSQKIHMQILKEESNKDLSFQNTSVIGNLMNITYSFRRSKINNKISISELMEDYPIFFQKDDQFEEFKRLTAVSISGIFYQESSKFSKLLLQLFLKKQSPKTKLKQIEIENRLNLCKDDSIEIVDMVKEIYGLYVLPVLLNENLENFVEEVPDHEKIESRASIYPKIFAVGGLENGKFYIFAEEICIIQGHNFVTTVALLMSFYYTLNISYPKEISHTLKFLQKFYLRINGGSIPQKIFSLYNKLHSLH